MKQKRSHFDVVSTRGVPPAGWHHLVDPKIKSLTLMEIAALCQLRKGLPDKLIAANLQLTVAAVRFHLRNASKKTECKSRLELALWADRSIYPPGWLLRFFEP